MSVTLATNLERAAAALARLNSALAWHPLAPGWAYRAQLDACAARPRSMARRSTRGISPP